MHFLLLTDRTTFFIAKIGLCSLISKIQSSIWISLFPLIFYFFLSCSAALSFSHSRSFSLLHLFTSGGLALLLTSAPAFSLSPSLSFFSFLLHLYSFIIFPFCSCALLFLHLVCGVSVPPFHLVRQLPRHPLLLLSLIFSLCIHLILPFSPLFHCQPFYIIFLLVSFFFFLRSPHP